MKNFKNYIPSMAMMGAAVMFSLIYFFVAFHTGAATTKADIILTEASESDYVTLNNISVDSIEFKPTSPSDTSIFYCLIDGSFFDKMTGYGMEPNDFLDIAGDKTNEETIVVTKTKGFSVLNYVTTPSEKLEPGKVYYLLVGEQNTNGEFDNTNINCIKIQL